MKVSESRNGEPATSRRQNTPLIEVQTPVALKKLDLRFLKVHIVGTSPLICHAWSKKARDMMLDKQMKKTSSGRQAKNPVEDFRQSLYKMPNVDGFGFPAIAFKAAAVDAANAVELKKTEMRGAFQVEGDLVKIDAEPVTIPLTDCDREYWEEIKHEREHGVSMRSDMVRIAMGTSDIRFRGQFVAWRVALDIKYNASVISPEQIVNLFNVSGFSVGVGEHRPQRDGGNGMFEVA